MAQGSGGGKMKEPTARLIVLALPFLVVLIVGGTL